MRRFPRTKFGDPILRKKVRKVSGALLKSPSFQRLIDLMFFTLRDIGVGLAAPQVGKSLALAVVRIRKSKIRPRVHPFPPTAVINPRIVKASSKKVSDWEGCLSLPKVRGLVPRPVSLEVAFVDRSGQKRTKRLTGFQARVFQHEIDHLGGVLFVDRMVGMESLITEDEFKKRILKRGLRSR